jgi:PAS domain S-box-containing protein
MAHYSLQDFSSAVESGRQSLRVAREMGLDALDLRLSNIALERQIAAMFESVTDGIVLTDLQGNVIQVNEAALHMHGYKSPAEVIGQVALEFLSQDNRPGAQESLKEISECGPRSAIEYRLLKKDGTSFDVEVSAALLRDEQGNPIGYVAITRDVSARKREEQQRTELLAQVREQARRVQQILDTVPEGVILLDGSRQVVQANPLGERSVNTLAGAKVGDTLTHLGDLSLAELLATSPQEQWHETTSGGHTFRVIARPIEAGPEMEDKSDGWVIVIRDVTHEQEMEERVRRQDRLAVIGQLAGGIAHDFNNVLTAIQGFTGLVLDGLAPDDPIRADLEEVTRAADRAGALTGQLLIFSRKQVWQPRSLDLNKTMTDLEKMLRRLIGENIELSKTLSPALGRVMADPGQIEQVVMNLVVNARDAMPQGGQLVLETRNVELDEAYTHLHPGVQPGAYVVLAVSDTGVGMTAEVKSHIFEPYFTTKEKGKGTGLGLATVHGIVAQSGGHIEVYSEPGMGTTFKVYLPQVEAGEESTVEESASGGQLRGTETVLLVEDDNVIREMARRGLEHYGYTVLEAHCPSKAIDVSGQHDGPIDLLVTDVVLPEKGGQELAKELAATYPETKVLYTSGYTDDAIGLHGVLRAGQAFLEKPFTLIALARHVRKVLDEATP